MSAFVTSPPGTRGGSAALRCLASRGLLALVVVTAGPVARAQEDAVAGSELNELNLEALLRMKVVTASGSDAEESDLAPANVFTVLGTEIASQGWRSIAEVLAHTPGIYVVDDYVTYNVGVRGASGGLRAGSRILKVMIDGTDVSFRPDLNALIGPELIPIEIVERVEIARGPLSAVYGANAFLATVNIITVAPDRLHARLAAHGTVRPMGSQRTRFGAGASAAAAYTLDERLGALLAVSYGQLNRGRLRIEDTLPARLPLAGVNPAPVGYWSHEDWARPFSLYGRLSADLGRGGAITVQGGVQRTDSNGEFQLNSLLTGKSRYSLLNLWSAAQHDKAWAPWLSSQVGLSYSRGAPTGSERLYLANPTELSTAVDAYYFTRNFGYTAVDGKASLTARYRSTLRVSGGVDVSHEQHDTLYYTQHWLRADAFHQPGEVLVNGGTPPAHPEVSINKVAPNLHAMYSPAEGIRLYADGRIDYSDGFFPTQYSWRASAGWRILPTLVLKVFGGKAFQTPSTVVLYTSQGFGSSANDIQGYRNIPANTKPLVPQTVESGEVVLSYLRGDRISINLATYLQLIDNQITFRQLSGSRMFVAQNEGEATSYGAEINATARIWRFEPYVRLSRQWFEDPPFKNDPAVRGPTDVPPPMIPSYWMLAGLRYSMPAPKVTLDATWRFVGERGANQSNLIYNDRNRYALAAYNQLDLAATGTFTPLGSAFPSRVTLLFRNVTDQRYFEPGNGGIDIPMMGRLLQLTLTQDF